jgi:multicomponent Na+:H+ antiporter subunit F
MTVFFVVALLLVILLSVPFVTRVIVGPTKFDRVVGLNGIGTMVPVLMVLAGVIYGQAEMFVDMAVALYLLNLFTTLLIARYVRDKAEVEG